MKYCCSYFARLFTAFILMQVGSAQGEGVEGEWKQKAFFPDKQSYKVIESKPISVIPLADDLSGIPRILVNSYVHFAPDYFTIKNINSGGDFVIGSCFKLVESKLIAYPLGRFQRVMGKKIVFSLSGSLIEMTYSNAILLKLKKSPSPAREAELRSSYQKVLTNVRQKHRNQYQTLSCEEYIERLNLVEDEITKDTNIGELVRLLKEIEIKNINDDKNFDSSLRKSTIFTESDLPFEQIRKIVIEERLKSIDCKSNYLMDNAPDIARNVLEFEVKVKNLDTYEDLSISAEDKFKIKTAQKQANSECGGIQFWQKVAKITKAK